MGSEEGSFIYLFKNDCPSCTKMKELIDEEAKKQKIDVKSFNLADVEDAKVIAQVDKVPTPVYFNRGWKVSWIEEETTKKTLQEFFEHSNHEDDAEHGHDH
jgi:hypothetical protein